jgi:preprotein translocase subunit SecG
MAGLSVAGLVSITILSALMIVFSFLFNERGEPNISLVLLFAGLILAAVLAVVVLLQKNSGNN